MFEAAVKVGGWCKSHVCKDLRQIDLYGALVEKGGERMGRWKCGCNTLKNKKLRSMLLVDWPR
jgi:hypothetical protein